MSKYAVLSMDVEDWHHLYYFKGKANTDYSMLDGFVNYIDLLNKYDIKTTFFVLSELADKIPDQLKYAISCGHEIACHGKRHIRPIELPINQFKSELQEAKEKLESIIKTEVIGYRAPCYGIDNERYSIVQELGFKYSSSKMEVKGHPLYGELNLDDFEKLDDGIYKKNNMMEFALSTEKFLGKNIAVSGGGWIRLLPWDFFMKKLIDKYVSHSNTYFLYIHPFELSNRKMPPVKNTNLLTNIRARKGLYTVDKKIEYLISELETNKFEFSTFSQCYAEYCKGANQ